MPLYILAYEIGLWVSGATNVTAVPAFPEMHWHDGLELLWQWLMVLGKPLLIGLPLLAIGMAVTGYVLVRLFWRLFVVWKWHRRSHK